MKEIIAYIKSLVDGEFYGRITLAFEKGKVTHIKEEKSIKL